jgi:hypothetical protein
MQRHVITVNHDFKIPLDFPVIRPLLLQHDDDRHMTVVVGTRIYICFSTDIWAFAKFCHDALLVFGGVGLIRWALQEQRRTKQKGANGQIQK